jgi:adenylyl- and sulfurtransferase ThiI
VDIEDIAEKCKSLYGEKISGKTFVVRVKRS